MPIFHYAYLEKPLFHLFIFKRRKKKKKKL